MVTSVVPSPPRFLPSICIAHRGQQSHCSSIFHRVLLTHALALSASIRVSNIRATNQSKLQPAMRDLTTNQPNIISAEYSKIHWGRKTISHFNFKGLQQLYWYGKHTLLRYSCQEVVSPSWPAGQCVFLHIELTCPAIYIKHYRCHARAYVS